MKTCGLCASCSVEGSKTSCQRRKAERALPGSQPHWAEERGESLELVVELLGHRPDVDCVRTVEGFWALNDVFGLLKSGTAASRILEIRKCWPRLGISKLLHPDRRGHLQPTYFGSAEAVVIVAFSLLDDKPDELRFRATRVLLLHLGIADAAALLEEFAARSGRFADVERWMYVAGEREEEEDAERALEIEAVSSLDGAPDLYCADAGDGVLKVGRCRPNGEGARMRRLGRRFQVEHRALAMWRRAGNLESTVHLLLREFRVDVHAADGSLSREHFRCRLDRVLSAVHRADCEESRATKRSRTEERREELQVAELDALLAVTRARAGAAENNEAAMRTLALSGGAAVSAWIARFVCDRGDA